MDAHPLRVVPLRGWVYAVYILQAVGIIFVWFPWLIALIANYAKRDDAKSDPTIASHFDWQIRTFWVTLALGVIGTLLFFTVVLAPLGLLCWVSAYVYAIYRVIMGLFRLLDGKPAFGH